MAGCPQAGSAGARAYGRVGGAGETRRKNNDTVDLDPAETPLPTDEERTAEDTDREPWKESSAAS